MGEICKHCKGEQTRVLYTRKHPVIARQRRRWYVCGECLRRFVVTR